MTSAHDKATSGGTLFSTPVRARPLRFGRIIAIALASFREVLRERTLYVLVFFALLLIGMALLLGELSVGQERRIVLNVGLGAIRIFGTVMAIVLGVRLVEREIERRTIYVLLVKPVRRWEVLVGKFIGGALVLLLNVTLMMGGLVLTLTAVTQAWVETLPLLLPVVFLFWLQFLMAAAIAMMFSTFSTAVLSLFFASGIVLIGHASREFAYWAEAVRSPVMAFVCRVLYYALPNLQNLNFTAAVVHERTIPLSIVGLASAYAGLYLLVMLLLAAILFDRREFR